MPGLLLLILLCTTVRAVDDSLARAWLDNSQKGLLAEYRRCTGDSDQTSQAVLHMWKKELTTWVESSEYPQLLREYRQTSGKQNREIHPCDVFHWKLHKGKTASEVRQAFFNDSMRNALQTRKESTLDSALAGLHFSAFDFDSIPFGISRAHCLLLCTRRALSHDAPAHDSVIFIGDFQLFGRLLPVTLHFGTGPGLHTYTLESMHLPADSLESRVRPLADSLSAWFSSRVGEPDSIVRVGFFDIQATQPATYRIWRRRVYRAELSFSQKAHMYNVNLQVQRRTGPVHD